MPENITIRIGLALLFAGLHLSFIFSSGNAEQNTWRITFSNYVGNKLLVMDSVTYKNNAQQDFIITQFKYYIGNITLKQKNGTLFSGKTYYLVNEAVQDSKQIKLEGVPPGIYDRLEFTVGVDSLHNCSGAQSGALDPVNAMFWAWNTGYIFFKLEGKSPVSYSPAHLLEFHIGGYKHPNNCLRKVSLDISGNKTIHLQADIARFFNDLDFAKISSVTDFHYATIMADNYAQMFRIR